MAWVTIVWSGFVATLLSSAFFWVLHSYGWTRFSPSTQLGCLLRRDPRSPATETLGFVLLLLLGSTLVPAAYGIIFDLTSEASASRGAAIGILHGIVTSALLPILGTISACIRSGALPRPGHFGTAWGRVTPVGLVVGHLIYGATVGAILAAF